MSLPERLGRLRRVGRIGAGGFATVWLYHDDELDSPVAVKALADNWAVRDDVRDRFLEEARILRRADSDHVVRVYDIGEHDGTPYFVMSYADRGSVASLIEPGSPLSPGVVAGIVAQAGEGLDVLHRHGVIHRDIKPQNLLLKSTPESTTRVLVADLGVAKAMLHASGLTQVVGTPAYMAPEQATGIGVDKTADVHALGAVAYHLLTGRVVREGGFGALADPQLPPAPSRLAAGVPPAVDDVLLRAIDPDPAGRWPDVRSFTRALLAATSPDGGAAGGGGGAGRRPGAPEPVEAPGERLAPPPRPPGEWQAPEEPVGERPVPEEPPPLPLLGTAELQPSTPGQPEPVESPGPAGTDGRRGGVRPGVVALLFVLVLVGAFAATYAITALLR